MEKVCNKSLLRLEIEKFEEFKDENRLDLVRPPTPHPEFSIKRFFYPSLAVTKMTSWKKIAEETAAIERITAGTELVVKLLLGSAVIPARQTTGSVGYDLSAAVKGRVLPRGGRTIVRTGIAVQLPEGTYGRITDRPVLLMKGLSVSGVIHSDYCKEIEVIVHNHGHATFTFEPGTPIGQIVLERIASVPVVALEETGKCQVIEPLSIKRRAGGFICGRI